MLLFFVVVAYLVLICKADNTYTREEYERLFFDYIVTYDLMNQVPNYLNDGNEFARRLSTFADNYDKIEQHNAKGLSYSMAINKFAHFTLEEFHDYLHLGGIEPPPDNATAEEDPIKVEELTEYDYKADYPAQFDWSNTGAVGPVLDQGSCGSCWAFATAGTLEGAYFVKQNSQISLSVQEIVSCDFRDKGCNGGWVDTAFKWVRNNHGLTNSGNYPYTSGSTGSTGVCITSGYTNNPQVAPVTITDVQEFSLSALQAAVLQQPVAIAIEADSDAFQFYSSGVITDPSCGTQLDHAILLVGYGTQNGIDYWKIKNSWGTSWGLNGFGLIERSNANICGVLSAPSFATV